GAVGAESWERATPLPAVISTPISGVSAVAAVGVLCAFCCVMDPLPGHCLRRTPRANPLVAAVLRTKWLLRQRCSATCLRRGRPGQARRRQGGLQISAVRSGHGIGAKKTGDCTDRGDLYLSSVAAAPVGSPSLGSTLEELDRARLRAIAASDRPLAPHECGERARRAAAPIEPGRLDRSGPGEAVLLWRDEYSEAWLNLWWQPRDTGYHDHTGSC